MAATIDDLCRYLRIEKGSRQEAEAERMMHAARAYLLGAGIPDAAESDPRYVQAVYMIACEWFDKRGVTSDGKNDVSIGARQLIKQMQYDTRYAGGVGNG